MFIWIIFFLFASVGMVQCGMWAADAFKSPGSISHGCYVIPLYDDADRLEARMRLSVSQIRRRGAGGEAVLLVDMGLNDECRAICERFLLSESGVYICDREDLAEAIARLDGPWPDSDTPT